MKQKSHDDEESVMRGGEKERMKDQVYKYKRMNTNRKVKIIRKPVVVRDKEGVEGDDDKDSSLENLHF